MPPNESHENPRYAEALVCPVLLPTGRDADLVCATLERHGISGVACKTLTEVTDHIESGCGPAILDLGALDAAAWQRLEGVLEAEPEWSEQPLIIVNPAGASSGARAAELFRRRGTTALSRPTDERTLVGVVRVALDSRRRQLQVRDLLHELREANQRLDARSRQLQRLAMVLTQAEEAERKRVAQTLHDGLQQLLAAARVSLRAARPPKGKDARREGAIDDVDEILMEAIQASRTLSHELSPPLLHQAGIGPALEQLGKTVKTQYDLDVRVECDEEDGRVADAERTFLFEAARELLYNVHVHSGCSTAEVTFRLLRDAVELTVSDEGDGFDPDTCTDEPDNDSGIGLFGIRERAGLLGGEFIVNSKPGDGTEVILRLPTNQPAETEAEAATAEENAAGQEETMHAEKPIRVLIVDDHRVMRQGLVSLLRDVDRIEVVGEAGDGTSAATQVERLRPDVVIMDVSLPDTNGIELTRQLRRGWPDLCVIGLSMFEEKQVADQMLAAGASAYLVKSGPTESLIESVLACSRDRETWGGAPSP